MPDTLGKYKNIKALKRTNCPICETPGNDPLIYLPDFPLTEIYVSSKPKEFLGLLDLEWYFCKNCNFGYLGNIIPPDLLYADDYFTHTGGSSSATIAVQYFLNFIEKVLPPNPVKAVFDIGCNDGYLLDNFQNKAKFLYGCDPVADKNHLDSDTSNKFIFNDFFENIDFDRLEHRIDLFISSHTFEHISDPLPFLQKALDAGKDDSWYFFQFPGLEGMINDAHFDQVFHQHYNYFSVRSISEIFNRSGAQLVDWSVNPYHWNSLMIAFKKSGIENKNHLQYPEIITEQQILKQFNLFKNSMGVTSGLMENFAHDRKFGFGAALMLPVLNYHLNNQLHQLDGIIDEDPSKVGKFYLNLPVPIISTEMVRNPSDSIGILTAINSNDAVRKIIPKMINLNFKKIITPINIF